MMLRRKKAADRRCRTSSRYVAMIVLLGFPIATLMYLLACPRLMGYPRWKVLIPYAVLLTSAVFLAFAYVLHVRFPQGLLWR